MNWRIALLVGVAASAAGCGRACGHYTAAEVDSGQECEPATLPPTGELLQNPTFSETLSPWTVWPRPEGVFADKTQYLGYLAVGRGREGSSALEFDLESGVVQLGISGQHVPNRPCLGSVRATAWAATTLGSTARLSVGCSDPRVEYVDGREVYGSLMSASSPTAGGARGWTELSVEARVPSMCREVIVSLQADGDGTVRFDAASLTTAR